MLLDRVGLHGSGCSLALVVPAVLAVLAVTVKYSCNRSYMRMLAQHEYMLPNYLQLAKSSASDEAGSTGEGCVVSFWWG